MLEGTDAPVVTAAAVPGAAEPTLLWRRRATRIVDLADDTIFVSDVHGVTTQERGCPGAAVVSDDTALAIDDGQYAPSMGAEFAAAAEIALTTAQSYWDSCRLGDCLALAMNVGATIEQAKGIVMGAQRCGPEEAFKVLVATSQRENRKLGDVAAQIVSSVAEPGAPIRWGAVPPRRSWSIW